MKLSVPSLWICACIALTTSCQANAKQTKVEVEKNWQLPIQDQTLTGWTGGTTEDPRKLAALTDQQKAAKAKKWAAKIAEHWRVENVDGELELISDGHGPHLVTEREYTDFELELEWKIQAAGDSGIYLRGYPQVQIWDPNDVKAHRHGADKGSCGLWNNKRTGEGRFPLVKADKPTGEWNHTRVKMIGEHVWVWLNDQLVVNNARIEDIWKKDRPVLAKGPIHLQTHGSETRFRRIRIRDIDSAEANACLSTLDTQDLQFIEMFNGKNMDGWYGPVQHWDIEADGSYKTSRHGGGQVRFDKNLKNFVFDFEFKLTAGANNGIALRVPKNEKGYASVTGMEFQVLDDTHPNYAKLKPYQYHGSFYNLKPAQRGYLRPLGEWNHQRIILDGYKAVVELNGTRITSSDDLSAIKPKVEGIKGYLRTEGYLGFEGHGDVVWYRNPRVAELPDTPTSTK